MASHPHLARCSPVTQDILKSFKQKLTESHLEPHKDCTVWIRDANNIVVERPNNLWKTHFDRRRENYRCGFFTEAWQPFRCLGGVLSLEASDLLNNVLTNYLGKEEKSKADAVNNEVLPEKSTEILTKDEPTLKLPKGRSATGFDQLLETLKLCEERRVALRGGLSYLDNIKQMEKRKDNKEDKPINGMVLLPTSDLDFIFYVREASTSSPVSIEENSSDKNPNNETENIFIKSPNVQFGDKLYIRTLDVPSDSVLKVKSGFSDRLERIRKENLEFIHAIHRIVTIIRNLKPKDLKSKLPLTRVQLRDLERERKPEKEGKHTGLQYVKNIRHSTETTPDMSASTNFSRHQSLHNANKRRTRLFSILGHGVPLYSMGSATGRRSRMVESKEKDVRLETWDDLMRVNTKSPESEHNIDVALNVFTDTVAFKAYKWSRHLSRRDLSEHGGVDDKCKPIWQMVVNEKAKNTRYQDIPKLVKSKDPKAICQRFKKDIEKLNKNLSDTCNVELKKMERDRLAAFRYKFGTFNMLDRTDVIVEQLLAKMREPRQYVSRHPEMSDIISTKWLDELRENIYNILGEDDPEVNAALAKLGLNSQMRSKNLSQTNARLCLVVMSLPAYEICQISTQLAIKFVIEKIFQGNVEDFFHWLSLRKLPIVIVK